jgi:3-deoxy-7-phosphoheptulonate synthase
MIVVMEQGSTEEQLQQVIDKLVSLDFTIHRSTGVIHTVLGGVGPREVDPEEFLVMAGVRECHRVVAPYKLASRPFRAEGTVVRFGDVEVGGTAITLMAGPCCVESEAQIRESARIAAQAGARFLRASAFKPRTSPYSFQGLGEQGLRLLRSAADEHKLLVVSEISDHTQIATMEKFVDLLQVGARSMQNFTLLRDLGRASRPVLLKRGLAATVEELLMSAEYILSGGNYNVILCERGIRTFESSTRETMDIAAIPAVKRLSHLPILADPSHGTGRRDKVPPMARAAIAAGADGLLIEVHPDPDHALSDGPQTLYAAQLMELVGQLRLIAQAIGRTL